MWFVFPQIAGLGQSPMSIRFAIASLAEARAYLAHPVLGQRLRECAAIVAGVEGRTAREIFGPTDEMKLRSSMTLFARAATGEDMFQRCLDKLFRRPSRPSHAREIERLTRGDGVCGRDKNSKCFCRLAKIRNICYEFPNLRNWLRCPASPTRWEQRGEETVIFETQCGGEESLLIPS